MAVAEKKIWKANLRVKIAVGMTLLGCALSFWAWYRYLVGLDLSWWKTPPIFVGDIYHPLLYAFIVVTALFRYTRPIASGVAAALSCSVILHSLIVSPVAVIGNSAESRVIWLIPTHLLLLISALLMVARPFLSYAAISILCFCITYWIVLWRRPPAEIQPARTSLSTTPAEVARKDGPDRRLSFPLLWETRAM